MDSCAPSIGGEVDRLRLVIGETALFSYILGVDEAGGAGS